MCQWGESSVDVHRNSTHTIAVVPQPLPPPPALAASCAQDKFDALQIRAWAKFNSMVTGVATKHYASMEAKSAKAGKQPASPAPAVGH
jgi:hypothetical protein